MCLVHVSQEILKYLMEGLDQQSLLYLCPGIVFQPNMTTGPTHRNLRQAYLHNHHFETLLHMFIWGVSKNTKISNGGSRSTKPALFVSWHSISTKYDHRSHPQEPKMCNFPPLHRVASPTTRVSTNNDFFMIRCRILYCIRII